jgi:maltose O-acetyltransferase
MRYTFTRNFLHYMSELEAMFMHPIKPRLNTFTWRKRELRYMGVSFGKEVFVGQNLFILLHGGVTLGNRCALGSNVQICNHFPITIGEDFLGASDLVLNSGLHDPLTLQPRKGPITIGDRVWCGIRVTVLGGARIGSDVAIGAGSLVTGEIPSGCVVAGVPARVIRTIDRTGIKVWSAFD